MRQSARRLLTLIGGAARDLGPLILVIVFFQAVVLRQPFPNIEATLVGAACVVLGLMLFVRGLEIGLFPLGEAMAQAFARKGSVSALLAFAFALGFATTVAEPALLAIAAEAARTAAETGSIPDDPSHLDAYALHLRLTVAVSVGVALVIGVVRIIRGWPILVVICGGYLCVFAMTTIAPREFIGIAYDSGGVTTSTITVPLVAALGVGLASSIRGRNPMADGFGLITFASLTPMVFVMAFGLAFRG